MTLIHILNAAFWSAIIIFCFAWIFRTLVEEWPAVRATFQPAVSPAATVRIPAKATTHDPDATVAALDQQNDEVAA